MAGQWPEWPARPALLRKWRNAARQKRNRCRRPFNGPRRLNCQGRSSDTFHFNRFRIKLKSLNYVPFTTDLRFLVTICGVAVVLVINAIQSNCYNENSIIKLINYYKKLKLWIIIYLFELDISSWIDWMLTLLLSAITKMRDCWLVPGYRMLISCVLVTLSLRVYVASLQLVTPLIMPRRLSFVLLSLFCFWFFMDDASDVGVVGIVIALNRSQMAL